LHIFWYVARRISHPGKRYDFRRISSVGTPFRTNSFSHEELTAENASLRDQLAALDERVAELETADACPQTTSLPEESAAGIGAQGDWSLVIVRTNPGRDSVPILKEKGL
jgi:hypothetical protein